MALTIFAGWDPARIGTATLGWDDGSARTVSSTNGTWAHVDLTSVMGASNYDDFAGWLDGAMDAVSAGNTVTFTVSTLVYKLVRGSAWTITSTTNTLMRNILGLPLGDGSYPISSTDEGGGVHSISSTRRPYYAIVTAMGGKNQVDDDYEQDGIAEDGEAGDASYGVAVSAVPEYMDFVIPLEPQAAVKTRWASATVPWTYRDLFRHARNFEPISLYDGTNHEVVKLRGEGASFHPTTETGDYFDRWNIPFRTRVKGRI